MDGDRKINLADWMSELPESLHDTPLNELAIPGSHNSFSFSLDPQSGVGPDDEGGVGAFVSLLGPVAKAKLHKWAVTQTQNFTEQLNAGIRYFDFRIASRIGYDDIFFIHKQYGGKVMEGLKEICSFLEQHPKELVILDFNHFYKMTASQHKTLVSAISEIFGSKICMFVGVENVTLNMMWENQLQAIIIYHHPEMTENCDVWLASSIKAFWANTPNVSSLVAKLEQVYSEGRPKGLFYSWQGILTPDMGAFMANINGSLRDTFASKSTPAFIEWLKTKRRGSSGINICITDFTDIGNFPSSVISLNYKA